MPYHRPIPEQKNRGLFGVGMDTVVQAEKMIQIALLLPCAAFIGWLIGAWADGKLHTHWIGLAGIVFGGISGLVGAVKMALAAGHNVKMDDTEQDETGQKRDENRKGNDRD
jgi:hypothetical protein